MFQTDVVAPHGAEDEISKNLFFTLCAPTVHLNCFTDSVKKNQKNQKNETLRSTCQVS